MVIYNLDKEHEFIDATVYADEDLTESHGKVVEKFTNEEEQVSFRTDTGFEFTSWDVEYFDCDNTIVLFKE